MKRKTTYKTHGARHLVLAAMPLLAAVASPSFAVTYNLVAGPATINLPDGTVNGKDVPVWGFGCADQACLDASGSTAAIGAITVPGPALKLPPGDTTGLTINLTNNLTSEPVSIIIDGLPMPTGSAPTYVTDGNGKQRVQSLTKEAAPGGAVSYTWTNVKPGTLLYRSGTHMQVQDQMGLYGAVTHDAQVGQAYTDASSAYDKDVTLLYSEIDPVIHNAVAAGNFGRYPATGTDQCTLPVSAPRTTPLPNGWVCSTVNYEPKFFLINGKPYNGAGSNEFAAGLAGQKTLIRFLNAGLQTHVPVLNGVDMTLIAEDGNLYPYAKTQYSAFLPAMKTIDAIVTSSFASGSTSLKLPVVDRMLNLSNNGAANGGMLAYLTFEAALNNAPKFNASGCLPGPLNVATGGSVNCILSAHSTVSPAPATLPTFSYALVSAPSYVSIVGNTITAAPKPATFDVDGVTVLTPADVSGTVEVKVTESPNGAVTNASFAVNVTSNTAPTISSVPVTTANVGNAYSYTVVATDVDQPAQSLSFSAVTAPVWLSINPTTGAITGTPTAVGNLPVTIRVTDSGTPALSTEQSFTVNVSKNTAPSIKSVPVTTATVGVGYSYSVVGTDTDVPAQTLSYSLVNAPAWLSINPTSGVITGTPTAAGNQSVTVRVTDSGTPALSGNQAFTIAVAANKAPVVGNDVFTVLRNSANNQLPILNNDSDASGGLDATSVLITSLPSAWTRTVAAGKASYSKGTKFTAATCTNKFPGASVDASGNCVMPANQYVLPKLGLAIVNAAGEVSYKPALNFTGSESFGYTVADTLGLRSSGSVRVNVRK